MNNIDYTVPFILDESAGFAVVYKPPRMHSAPLRNSGGDTLLDWYAHVFPPVMAISGRKAGEGGLLHRLDFETQGLVLFAKNVESLHFLSAQQDTGNFVKEYSAICRKPGGVPPSFPLFNGSDLYIESYFRPFGPGSKQVRPVTDTSGGKAAARRNVAKDRGGCYRTEIVNIVKNAYYAFTLRLKRGFRHQIRCHLAWMGCPVLNDPVYGEQVDGGFLALRSTGLFFTDPDSGEQREYRIPPLEILADSM